MSTNGAWVGGVFYDGIQLTAADLNANNAWLISQVAGVGLPNTWTSIQTFALGLVTSPLTVATLPGSPVDGQREFVVDATSTTFQAAVVGSGTHHVPVYYDGALVGWRVG